MDWYSKAAEQEDEDAQCRLGFLYESARGWRAEREEAVQWYRAAAGTGPAPCPVQSGMVL